MAHRPRDNHDRRVRSAGTVLGASSHRAKVLDCESVHGPQRFIWDGSKACHDALESGFVHLTEEAAEKHYEAFKNLLGKKS